MGGLCAGKHQVDAPDLFQAEALVDREPRLCAMEMLLEYEVVTRNTRAKTPQIQVCVRSSVRGVDCHSTASSPGLLGQGLAPQEPPRNPRGTPARI